jgi:hypothetical protein
MSLTPRGCPVNHPPPRGRALPVVAWPMNRPKSFTSIEYGTEISPGSRSANGRSSQHQSSR